MQAEETYRSIFENAVEGIFQATPEGKVIVANPALARILGYQSPEELLAKLTDLNRDFYASPGRRAEYKRLLESQGFIRDFEARVFRKDGSTIWISINSRTVRDPDGRVVYYEGFITDISERKRAEEALRNLVDFEKLTTSISTQFINLLFDEIDQEINRSLQKIGNFAGVDRSYLFLFADDGKRIDHTHEWCAPGIESHMDRLKGIGLDEKFPWLAANLKKNEVFNVPRVSALPHEAREEKQEFQQEKIKSVLLVPIVSHGSLLGFLGFDSVRKEREWPENNISLLKIVGEIFANTLEHKWAERLCA